MCHVSICRVVWSLQFFIQWLFYMCGQIQGRNVALNTSFPAISAFYPLERIIVSVHGFLSWFPTWKARCLRRVQSTNQVCFRTRHPAVSPTHCFAERSLFAGKVVSGVGISPALSRRLGLVTFKASFQPTFLWSCLYVFMTPMIVSNLTVYFKRFYFSKALASADVTIFFSSSAVYMVVFVVLRELQGSGRLDDCLISVLNLWV